MSEIIKDFPDSPPVTRRYETLDMDEGLNRAIFGEGLAVMPNLGLSNEDRKRMIKLILANNSWIKDSRDENGPEYCSGIDSTIIDILKQPLADIISRFLGEPYGLVNASINHYTPGTYLSPHFDFGRELDTTMGEPAEGLTIIYVLDGYKDLVVWPRLPGELQQSPVTIRQSPDMAVILRGGAFEKDGLIYPAILHAVPPVSEESTIFSCDIMRLAAHEELADATV